MKQPVTRIWAKNFRSLADVDVELRPFTVLIGPNGSGKSNVLRVLEFLGTTARFDLVEALDQWGGFAHVQRQDGRRGTVELGVDGDVTTHASFNAPDSYYIRLRPGRGALTRGESFTFKRTAGRGRRMTITGTGSRVTITEEGGEILTRRLAGAQTTALATLPKLADDEGGRGIREFSAMLQDIRVFDPNVDRARGPSPSYGGRLAEDASNLADAMQGLQRRSPTDWERLLADLRRCLPGLRDVVFSLVGGPGRSVVTQLVESGISAPIDLRDASFGTVRLLSLLCLLHDPEPPAFVAIEEIDHGLHPYALDILADRLRDASSRTQFLVATHSPTFVNRLSADEMVICERDAVSGQSIIPALSRDEIARALHGMNGRAGELWFAGALGGVPD